MKFNLQIFMTVLCQRVKIEGSKIEFVAMPLLNQHIHHGKRILKLRFQIRPERCIVTIASLDQWLATIEKHRHQWLAD